MMYAYYIYLPYYKVKNSSNIVTSFVGEAIEGLKLKMPEYGMSTEELDEIKEAAIKEVTGNPENYAVEGDVPE